MKVDGLTRGSRRERRRLLTTWFLVGAALVLAVVPIPPTLVERFYSSFLYLRLQNVLTRASDVVSIALFDVLLLAAMAWVVWVLATCVRAPGRTVERLAQTGVRIARLAAIAYLGFFLLWGLNYRREPLSARLDHSNARVTVTAMAELAAHAVGHLNAFHRMEGPGAWPQLAEIQEWLQPAFEEAQLELGMQRTARGARPKVTLLQPYFRATQIDGMTDPFLLETLVNSELLPFELPFLVAHEWAHLAGYANEAEASFVGWLTCMKGDEYSRYSAWLFLYSQLLRHLPHNERAVVTNGLDSAVMLDLAAVSGRLSRSSSRLQVVSSKVYDHYLRANRVSGGIKSYDGLVALVVGTRFDDAWSPVLQADVGGDNEKENAF
jgi:hypothetical protein